MRACKFTIEFKILVVQFKQDSTKQMAEWLDKLELTYTYIEEQYEASTDDDFSQ